MFYPTSKNTWGTYHVLPGKILKLCSLKAVPPGGMSTSPRLCSLKSYSKNRRDRVSMRRGREAVQNTGTVTICAVSSLASATKSALFALPSSLIHTFQNCSTKVARCLGHDCELAEPSKTNDDFKMCSKDTLRKICSCGEKSPLEQENASLMRLTVRGQ